MQDEDFKMEVLRCMKKNTEAIEKLTRDTEGLVDAWNASAGFIRVMKAFGKLMLWVAAIGTPIITFLYWLKTGNWK